MNKSFAEMSVIVIAAIAGSTAQAGAFISSAGNPESITHPSNYFGSGGEVTVSFCVDPDSESISELDISAQNAAIIWNQLNPVTNNLLFGANNDIPFNAVDFESTLVHELGHCIGLGHPNLGFIDGVIEGADTNYTQTTTGANTNFDLNFGPDAIRGSADDLRGDDVNRHWFRTVNNNPFTLGNIVDSTTYSLDISDLPSGDNFVANPDRNVAPLFGLTNTEAVMQQGATQDEDQRRLGHDDVATIRLGMAGVDETQSTGDDYTINVNYIGVNDNCDVRLIVEGGGFAQCSVSFTSVSAPNHVRITSATITLASSVNWFFNQTPLGGLEEEFFEDGFENTTP